MPETNPSRFDPFADEIPATSLPPELDQVEHDTEPPPTLASPLGVGLHDDVPEHQYHSDPCATPSLNPSLATVLVQKNARHAYDQHPKLGAQRGKRPTRALDTGSIVHSLVLGCGKDFVRLEYENYKTKAAQQDRDRARARGLIPILAHELEPLEELAERIKATLHIPEQHREVVAIWTRETEHGPCLCRCMIDALEIFDDNTAAIVDLKIVSDAALDSLRRSHVDYGYHIQAAANVEAIQTLFPACAGRTQFLDLCVEVSTGYFDRVGHGGSMAELGHLSWSYAQHVWTQCLTLPRAEDWPAYELPGGCPRYLEAPPWELQRIHEARIACGMRG
jgi:hypothetical protein